MHMMMQQMHHHSMMQQACLLGTCAPVLPGVYMQPVAQPLMGYEGAECSLLSSRASLGPLPPTGPPPGLAHRKPAGLELGPAPARPTTKDEDDDDDDAPSLTASFQYNNDGDLVSIGSQNSPDDSDAPEGMPEAGSLVPSSWQCGDAAPPQERLIFKLFTVGYDACGARWKHNFFDMCTVGIHCIANRITVSHNRLMTWQQVDAKNIDLWVDCQRFKNPDRDPKLSQHVGENIYILEDFTQCNEFLDRVVCELGMLGLRFV